MEAIEEMDRRGSVCSSNEPLDMRMNPQVCSSFYRPSVVVSLPCQPAFATGHTLSRSVSSHMHGFQSPIWLSSKKLTARCTSLKSHQQQPKLCVTRVTEPAAHPIIVTKAGLLLSLSSMERDPINTDQMMLATLNGILKGIVRDGKTSADPTTASGGSYKVQCCLSGLKVH
ncbi:hypothetical protein OPV22_023573 [Ensete ventricosum]|uniref:Roadblock/LAMTOR2 domain-containing protein n=1 Tax=Ensete ventricosum TaxID=4639 RepID=A0AAV8QML1_ENSVE|nr:hypothetical protein OPV22_023573 [Ensete ventricosum]